MAKKGPATITERLHRIEGQIRGLESMVDVESDPQKLLAQLQAAISSLESVKVEIIKRQMKKALLREMDSIVNLLK